jgi:hypothetical protein
MAVTLFKDGRAQTFDEYTFVDRLEEGWSLTNEPKKVVKIVESEPEKVEEPEENAQEEEKPVDYAAMTKRELEEHARGFNDANGKPIELDRRMNKKNMLKSFNEQKG